MAAVAFDPTAFKARYPEFAAVPDATLTACFMSKGFSPAGTAAGGGALSV